MSPSGKLFFYTLFLCLLPIYIIIRGKVPSLIKRKLTHKGNYSFSSNQIIPYLCPSKREHKGVRKGGAYFSSSSFMSFTNLAGSLTVPWSARAA